MTHRTRLLVVLFTGLTLAPAARATGQPMSTEPRNLVFVDVNVGVQPRTHGFETSATFPTFGETASVSTSQTSDGGSIFDVRGGVRVWRSLAAAVGLSRFTKNGDGTASFSIPNPIIFGRPTTSSQEFSGLERKEVGIHLMVVWFIPATDKIDLSLSAGPSFFNLDQDIVRAAVAGGAAASGVNSESETAVGTNVGVDGNYLFTQHIGAGIFLRYSSATIDLPTFAGQKVGGFQAGVGLRVRF